MRKKKKIWEYEHSSSSKHGTMICRTCKFPIVGYYRVYKEYRGYEFVGFVVEHRKCSASDPMWVKWDTDRQEYKQKLQNQIEAFIAFGKQWETDSLQDEVHQLQASLQLVLDLEAEETAPEPALEQLS